MKRFLCGAVFLATASSAMAADMAPQMYQKAPPMAAQPVLYGWTGFYVGGHLGGTFRDGGGAFGSDDDGRFIGGGQIGADYQFSGNWVAGIEAQYSYVDRNDGDAFLFPGGTFNNSLRGLGSVTGRLGYTWGPGLLYVKGGYAYADRRNVGTGAFTFDNGRDGYTVGGGLEYMFAQNWSGKIEYQYFHFDNNQLFVGAPLVGLGDFRDEEHTIKVGLNYHFNFASPLTPRY